MKPSAAVGVAQLGVGAVCRVRTSRASYTIVSPAIFYCAVLLGAAAPVGAEVHGDLDLLRAVRAQRRSSVQSIRTWKGRAVRERRIVTGDSDEYSVTTHVEFALDQRRDLARWNQNTVVNRWVVNGQPVPRPGHSTPESGIANGIVTGNRFFSYMIPDMEKNAPVRTLVIKHRRFAEGMEADFNFDPRVYLNEPEISRRLKFFLDHAANPKLSDWYVTREGRLVTVECRFGPKGTNINRYVFDMSKGAHVVSLYKKDDVADHLTKYEYMQIDGVWVPATFTDTLVNVRGGVKTVLTIKVTWWDNVVNRTLRKDEFSLAKLGVQAGDLIQDDIARIRFQYREDAPDRLDVPEMDAVLVSEPVATQPVPATGASADKVAPRSERASGTPATRPAPATGASADKLPPRRDTAYAKPTIILAVAACVVCVLVAALAWKRRRA